MCILPLRTLQLSQCIFTQQLQTAPSPRPFVLAHLTSPTPASLVQTLDDDTIQELKQKLYKAMDPPNPVLKVAVAQTPGRTANFFRQLQVLALREARDVVRNKAGLIASLVFPGFLTTIYGCVFWQVKLRSLLDGLSPALLPTLPPDPFFLLLCLLRPSLTLIRAVPSPSPLLNLHPLRHALRCCTTSTSSIFPASPPPP